MKPVAQVPGRRSRQRWILPLLAVLFMGPLLAAWLFYFVGDGWRPGGAVNHGRLLDNPVTLRAPQSSVAVAVPGGPFRGKWSLVYVTLGRCDKSCVDALDKIRRVRLALGEKSARVERILLHDEGAPGGNAAAGDLGPGLATLSLDDEYGRSLLLQFEAASGGALAREPVFIVDPLGNVIMAYAPGFEMRGMLADLKRLLKLSRIG